MKTDCRASVLARCRLRRTFVSSKNLGTAIQSDTMSRAIAINKNKIAFHLCSVITTHPPAYTFKTLSTKTAAPWQYSP